MRRMTKSRANKGRGRRCEFAVERKGRARTTPGGLATDMEKTFFLVRRELLRLSFVSYVTHLFIQQGRQKEAA